MTDSGHRARRRFGQHFLHDPAVVARIIAAVAPSPDDALVEIGPGQGVLTRALLNAGAELDVVEIDRDLAFGLERDFRGLDCLRIHNVDALKFDFSALAGRRGPLRLVGNLPYNISTPLMFHLIACDGIRDMHFMLQKEVAKRIQAGPGSRAYGRLSVMMQFYCAVEVLFEVGPGAFRPPPKVHSAVIRLRPHLEPPVTVADPKCLQRIVTAAFGQRRKMLSNALKSCLDQAQIRALGIDPRARPETLGLFEFAALANALAAVRR